MQINIVDSMMGTGKTSAMINFINASDKDSKFLYITPYLTEVDRIIKWCPLKAFKQPERYGTKKRGIKELFERGVNIVSTHSLLREFDEEIIDLAYNGNYILVMDEVADVISRYGISRYDLETILRDYTEVVDGHLLRWTARDYTGNFHKHKKMCDLGCLGIYGDTVILWLFPLSTFKGFRNIFILTYMFEAQMQKYYFDYYDVRYQSLYVHGDGSSSDSPYELNSVKREYKHASYKSLIDIHVSAKLNDIGELDGSLSKSWYERNKSNKLMTTLKNNMINYFQHYARTTSKLNMWTTFKDFQNNLKGKGYAKGFIASNTRAINDYRDRTAMAYPINKYFNPYIKNFFADKNIKVDEDAYALSEMVQWIFRSGIRDGKPIQAYIPSRRMREILTQWINSFE